MAATLSPSALWSLPSVKAYLGNVTNTERDEELIRLANGVSAFMERTCRRVFVTRSFTEQIDGKGQRELFLIRWPIVTITSLTVRYSPLDTPTTLVQDTDFVVLNDVGAIQLVSTVAPQNLRGAYTVTYTAGEGSQDDATGVLADAQMVGLQVLDLCWKEKSNGQQVSSLTIGSGTVVMRPDWPLSVKNGLNALTRSGW